MMELVAYANHYPAVAEIRQWMEPERLELAYAFHVRRVMKHLVEHDLLQVKAPKLTATGQIDVMILHPVHGWIEFTACSQDPEYYGRLLFSRLLPHAALPVITVDHDPNHTIAAKLVSPEWLAKAEASRKQEQLGQVIWYRPIGLWTRLKEWARGYATV